MNTILKTTLAMTAATLLFTGCTGEDIASDISNAGSSTQTGGGSNRSNSGSDTFTITKTALGFNIDWVKKYEGYSEVIYREVGSDKPRGDGYPLTHNYTGTYRTTCEKYSEDDTKVWYGCERDDVTYGSSVVLKKGVQYEWMSSYGVAHDLAEAEVHMEYVGDTLTIE
jgi:hypothetical protein